MAPHKTLSSQAVVYGGNMFTRIGHQELLACGRNGRAERGDSANSTSVQRQTQTQIHPQAGMRKQA